MDQKLNQFYQSEVALSKIVSIFTGIAIVIACLGLFGLISFVSEWKTKEIAMRKILGASVPNVMVLLSKEMLSLVLIATFLAWPVAYWAANRWLENFAFRNQLSIWTFILTTVIILIISLVTIFFHIIKAALKNPLHYLRYE